jgi:hypothetical protein
VQTGTTVVETVNYILFMQSDLPVVRLFKTSYMLQYVYAKRTFQNKMLKNVKFQQCNLALLMENKLLFQFSLNRRFLDFQSQSQKMNQTFHQNNIE